MSYDQNQLVTVLKVIFLIMITTVFFSLQVNAKTYYVDKKHSQASDLNPGSENNPWRTIQHAADTVVAGDTVYVKEGRYNEYIRINNSGTKAERIIFTAFPGHLPVIDGKGIDVPIWRGLFDSKNNDGITIDGFEVRHSDEVLIRLSYGDYLTIRNCIAHGNTNGRKKASGIFIDHSKNSFVEYNEVYNTGHNAITAESTNNTTFRNNYIHDNKFHNGINIFPKTTEDQVTYSGNNVKYNVITGATHGIYLRYQRNNQISNNLIYKNIHNGIYIAHHPDYTHTFKSDSKILNNTVVDNGDNGIHIENATHMTIKNNLIAYCKPFNLSIKNKALIGHNIDYNLYYYSSKFFWKNKFFYSFQEWQSATSQDRNSLQANPLFVGDKPNIYSLAPNSPAIDSGTNLTNMGIKNDIIGTIRPQNAKFDIGAYEYSRNSAKVSPPFGLKIIIK